MVVLAQLALQLYREKGNTLKDHMEELYSKYGFFCSRNGYFGMPEPSIAKGILDRLRSGGTYTRLRELVGPDREVNFIRDLGYPGYDSTTPDGKPTLAVSRSAPLLTVRLGWGASDASESKSESKSESANVSCLIQLRPSGTEPKFKYYLEMQGTPGMSHDRVREELGLVEEFLLEKLLEPTKNGLSKKS